MLPSVTKLKFFSSQRTAPFLLQADIMQFGDSELAPPLSGWKCKPCCELSSAARAYIPKARTIHIDRHENLLAVSISSQFMYLVIVCCSLGQIYNSYEKQTALLFFSHNNLLRFLCGIYQNPKNTSQMKGTSEPSFV
jgi:hypothetical protein